MSQGLRQASVRAVSGTTLTYDGDWHAMWDVQGIASGTFNERMISYANTKLSATYTNVNDAMQALAVAGGATNFGSLGTFDASVSGGGPSYEAESEVIFASMTGLDDTRRGIIDTLVAALKTASVWAKLDFLHVYAAHNAGAAIINWKNPGTWNATAVNSPTFTTDRGYTGNGTSSYLNTNYNAATASGRVYALDDCHLGVWVISNAAASATDIGAYTGPPGAAVQASYASSFKSFANGGSNDSTYGAASKHHVATRASAANHDTFRDGANKETKTNASTSIPNFNVYVCALNLGGAPNQYSTKQTAAAHVGSDLSDANVSAFYTALASYMTSVGAL